MEKEFEKYYNDMIFYGRKYLEAISSLPLKSDNAKLVDSILDDITYNCKLYMKTYLKKRVLTDEEKEFEIFNTPEGSTLEYFHKHRHFRYINDDLSKLINRIKEIEKERRKEIEKNL